MDNLLLKRPSVKITQEEFVLLRDYIYEQTGILFSENKMYLLNNRLTKRLLETNSSNFKDYYYYLKYDNSGSEFTNLLNVITTNETSFFRNSFHMDAFENYLVDILLEKKKNDPIKKIKIWSAGSSTGEEAYTLSMLLLDKLKDKELDFEINGTDISEQVLAGARDGIYSKLSLRNTSEAIIKKYFNQLDPNRYQLKPEVKKRVKFTWGNLANNVSVMLIKNQDIIFCRNVLIYFGLEARKKVIKMFYDKLVPQGYLFIGHSETLHGISTAFKIVHFKKAIFYQKN